MEPIFKLNEKIIDAGAMTGNLLSAAVDISEVSGFAVHEIYTGTPSGTLTVEASNDNVNYIAIDTNSVSAAGQKMVNVEKAHYRYVKVRYTFSAGTGSLTVYLSGKL